MNYTQLTAAIEAYTENTEASFVAEIPVFVQQAEQRIYNNVQFPSLRKNVTGATTANNKYLACPSDFLAVYSMAVVDGTLATGTYEYLLNKDVNFIREAYPTPTVTGTPKYYSLFGTQYTNVNALSCLLGPTPDANYQVEMHYFYYPPSITTAGESWLGNNYDPILLYGALMEAAVYMKAEADIISLYAAKYQEAMGELRRLCDALERGDAYRDGQTKLNANIKGNA